MWVVIASLPPGHRTRTFILITAMSEDTTAVQPRTEEPAEPIAQQTQQTMDINQIMAILPHRYPFLLIDRVLEIERRQRIVTIKNVTINEPFFQGHFPDFPIMPGVLMIEAIAQAGGCLLLTEFPDRAERLMLFTGIEHARFRRPVVPGDQLRFEVTVVQWRSRAVKMLGIATVEGKVACEATIMCQLVPRAPKPSIPEAASAE
jgi:3-hydroxyacyl-[acyl-carrier-protein] dehydratase